MDTATQRTAFRPASRTSAPLASRRTRVVVWLRAFGAAWGLATVLVLVLALMGQLAVERDWLGRGVVMVLLGGQCCLAALLVSRWRSPRRA